jgi:hypothetical protein
VPDRRYGLPVFATGTVLSAMGEVIVETRSETFSHEVARLDESASKRRTLSSLRTSPSQRIIALRRGVPEWCHDIAPHEFADRHRRSPTGESMPVDSRN